MNNLQIFKNDQFGEIRMLKTDSEPWFVGRDITSILGYSNSRKAIIDHVDEEDKGVTKCDTLGGSQEITVINESGLYSLILSCKMPDAKKFKKWVTSEVLPSIRKNGAYMTENTIEQALANPDFLIQLATKLKAEQKARAIAEQKIELDMPKVIFADSVAAAHTSILIGELAKILKQNGVITGANRLFERLRKEGYLIIRKGSDYNMPTQRSMEMGLFEIKETSIVHSDGSINISKTSKVTGKGQIYFTNKYI